MHFHAIAVLPGSRRKSIVNKSEDQMLTEYVLPYVSTGVIYNCFFDLCSTLQFNGSCRLLRCAKREADILKPTA